MLYKAKITRTKDGYGYELTRGKVVEEQASGFLTEWKAITALNEQIQAFNARHKIAMPNVSSWNTTAIYTTTEKDDGDSPQPQSQPQSQQEEKEKVKVKAKPKAKPKAKSKSAEKEGEGESEGEAEGKGKRTLFTPLVLQGYWVDNQGNIRLYANRPVTSKTIVLDPETFDAVVEAVNKSRKIMELKNANGL